MAKKNKKTASGKDRRVSLKEKVGSTKIEVKLYQLNKTLAEPFMRNGQFSFRLSFDAELKGRFHRFNKGRCPVITVLPTDVLQTENETAQRMIELFSVPQKTSRDGVVNPAGRLFNDVTSTENKYDIDLDEIFTAAIAAKKK
jgi:hypothetical protein